MTQILVVDDDATTVQLLTGWLRIAGYSLDTAASLDAMQEKIKTSLFDIVLLDIHLGDVSSLRHIPEIFRINPRTKVLVLTSDDSIHLAVDAMKLGASNFLVKPMTREGLLEAIEEASGPRNIDALANRASLASCGVISESPKMDIVFNIVNRVKDVDAMVLIRGETGTGKELFARAIHKLSNRSEAPFEAINCAAIPESLMEAELFGHAKGAFTDAKSDRKGLFETCTNGTLFLDEISEMPLTLQAKLLRVLQEREIRPLGTNKTIKINTRVIAATNCNLLERTQAGTFRPDLYFRLAVVEVVIPPLRERPEDSRVLAKTFYNRFCERFNKQLEPLSEEIMARLTQHDWTGNVRELQNSIERAVIMAENKNIRLEDLFLIESPKFAPLAVAPKAETHSSQSEGVIMTLAEERRAFEQTYITSLIASTSGNVAKAARKAGKFRADIYRMLEKHNINPDSFRHTKSDKERLASF